MKQPGIKSQRKARKRGSDRKPDIIGKKIRQKRYVAARARGLTKTAAMAEAAPHLTRGSAAHAAVVMEKDPETIKLLDSETGKWARISYAARDIVGHRLLPEAFPKPRVKQPFTPKEAAEKALEPSWLKVAGLMKERVEVSTSVGLDDLDRLSLDELNSLRRKLEAQGQGNTDGDAGGNS